MNDAEFAAQKRRVEKWLDKWRDLLWLSEYRFKHTWHRTRREEDIEAGIKDGGVLAQVKVQWEYLSANFDWYLPLADGFPEDELEQYVIHEMLHVAVAEMARGKKDPHEERVVTHLSLALYDMAKEKASDAQGDGRSVEEAGNSEGAEGTAG